MSNSRAYRQGWKNKTPVGFTRRVKLFEGHYDIRLEFIDEFSKANLFYTDKSEALADMRRFVDLCNELEKVMPAWPLDNIDHRHYEDSPVNTIQREYDARNERRGK